MNKHTPGPWTVGVSVSMGWPVFRLAEMENPDPDGGEVQADTALIEAAPDLLEACKAALSAPACEVDCDHDEGIWPAIKAAIAKAEGK